MTSLVIPKVFLQGMGFHNLFTLTMAHNFIQKLTSSLRQSISLYTSQVVRITHKVIGRQNGQWVLHVSRACNYQCTVLHLVYRSTPLEFGFSPAELLMSRRLCTTIPTTTVSRQSEVLVKSLMREKDKHLKERQKQNFEDHNGARAMSSLKRGQLLWLPSSRVEAHVEEQLC